MKSFPLAFPSPTSARDYARCFHNESEDEHRGQGPRPVFCPGSKCGTERL